MNHVALFLSSTGMPSLAQASPGGGSLMSFLPIVLIFGVLYFLVIRPQQKKTKDHQAMVSALRAGDVIVTQGGLIGKVTGVKDQEVAVELQQGVRVRLLRSHVLQKFSAADVSAKSEEKAS